MKTAGSFTYGYDANGNMTTGGGRNIFYDIENRPISIDNGGTNTSFIYDGDGGRVQKMDSIGTTVYIGGGYECTNGSCTKHIFAGGKRIATKKVDTGELNYYHANHIGSSSVITDSAGSLLQDLTYYPYGDTFSNTGSVDVPYKFTGKELDNSTGLYFYSARYYDPLLARFISADTIVPDPFDPQALNRYSYVLNNPIKYTDPSGHCAGWCIGAIIGAAIGGTSAAIQGGSFGDILLGATIGAASGAAGGWAGGYVSGAVNGYITGGAQWVLTATQSAAISIAGGIAAGAAAGLTSSALYRAAGYDTNIGQAIGIGALSGGVTAGFNSQTLPWAGDIVAKGLLGGGMAELRGGNFAEGFRNSAIVSAGSHWREIVNTQIFRKVLNSPNTAIGFVYGGVGHVIGKLRYAFGLQDNPIIIIGNNAIQFLNNPLMASAMTLGNTIVYGGGEDFSPDSITDWGFPLGFEEMQHTFQGERLGPFYFPAHIVSGIMGNIYGRGWHGTGAFLETTVHSTNPRPF